MACFLRNLFIITFIFSLSIQRLEALNSPKSNLSAEELLVKCDAARSKSQFDKLEKLADDLLAQASDDPRYEAYGLFYKGLAMLFTGQADQSVSILSKAEDMAKDIENDSILALSLNAKGIYHAMCRNNLFLAQNYYLKSLEAINRTNFEDLRARVYGNLIIMSHSKNDTAGLEHAQHIYHHGIKNGKWELQAIGSYYIALYNHLKGNDNVTEDYLKRSIEIFKKFPYEDIASVYTLYSEHEMQLGNIAAAEEKAREAVELAEKYKQTTLLSDAKLQLATVENLKGDFLKSNETAFEALELAKVQNMTRVVDCYRLIAKNYHSLGKKDEAINYMNLATNAMDTVSTVNMNRLMHEQAIMQDIEKKEQEAFELNQKIKTRRILNIVFAVAASILLIFLGYILSLYRRRNALYKSIVIQNTASAKRIEDLKERVRRGNERLMQAESQIEDFEQKRRLRIEDDKAQELYDRLCLLMERDRIYADTQLNRERVAEALGTNRTYLSQIIKEKAGMSYLQFINSYRINDAIRILSDKTQINYPLKQICSDLGFNSTATFYKLFQQAVGITPSVYRKQFLGISANSSSQDTTD